MLNETQANEKLLLDCLINKIDVDDLQKLQKILLIEIEKNSSRINNISKLDKPTTIIKLMPDKIICDYHKKNNLTNENDIMRKVDDLLNLNTKEMEKLWESFAEIKEKVLEFEKLRIKEGLFKISSLEDGLKILQTKRKSPFLQDLHSDENSIPINSNDNEDKYLLNFINNLKKENNEKVKIINQRVDLISNKQDNISNEILGKLKKDLVNESSRILEEFKTNLRNSMGKIEDQLHDKVDRLNLDEIARKIDTKIAYEVSKKLDKTDLKKNNGIINKKVLKSLNQIENLENKISKTLVDTLIDLQLDDAPLLVKKTAQADKCGSCNQIIPNSQNSHGNAILSQNNINYENAFPGVIKIKNKTRNNSILTNSVPLITEGDDKILKTSSNVSNLKAYSNMMSTILPEIKEKGEKKKASFNIEGRLQTLENKPIKNVSHINSGKLKDMSRESIKFSDASERVSNLINDELEKPFINPDSMLRGSSRIIENFEKKKNTEN